MIAFLKAAALSTIARTWKQPKRPSRGKWIKKVQYVFTVGYCCCCSVAKSCLTVRSSLDCSMPHLPDPHHLLEISQVHVHCVGDAIQPSHPLSSPLLLPSIFPSVRVFFNESVLHIRWPKIWSCSFSISLSNEYSGLISFRMDWVDLFEVQGTPKSYPQHFSSIASILQCSPFFTVQLSHTYMTTGKIIDLIR